MGEDWGISEQHDIQYRHCSLVTVYMLQSRIERESMAHHSASGATPPHCLTASSYISQQVTHTLKIKEDLTAKVSEVPDVIDSNSRKALENCHGLCLGQNVSSVELARDESEQENTRRAT